MNLKKNYKKYLLIFFLISAIVITFYVLFKTPQPGVADQGDFDRVMSASGLELTESYKNDPNLVRFYDFTVTDYKISDFTIINVLIRIVSTSMAYIITIISILCKLLGQDIFKTQYLAVAYSIIYIAAMYIIIKYININSKFKLTIVALLSLFMFMDGNYLLWFNSLYGEPMMITTLMLFIASFIYYVYNQYIVHNEKNVMKRIIFLLIAAFLFLGSKMQVLTSLPAILFILCKVLWENKNQLKKKQFRWLIVALVIITLYPIEINLVNGNISHDTQYNSVFYGVLNGSENPRQDLIDMGLNPDMAVESGKHAYEPLEKYVKYIPNTEITKQEFYDKFSNGKLVKFYLTHPDRLIEGMEYTASKAFLTNTSLGNYPQSYSEEKITNFDRYTIWSELRDKLYPKHFIFIVLVYFVIFVVSLYTFIKNKGNKYKKAIIELIWALMFIAMLQFPMPYVGNGQADTAKQLYLFNFIFDILIAISVYWCISKVFDLVVRTLKKSLKNKRVVY